MSNNKNQYEFKGTSKLAQSLLSRSEDYDVEFKESLNALESEDLVAFANSDEGGSILIGIQEIKKGKGKQKGKIIGCPINDKAKQKIFNKAESCVPPINIEVIIENLTKNPFFRIKIQNCNEKPYCTASGVYKIRGDGRKNALLTGRLLFMFVESESEKFIERYKEATKEVEDRITELLKYIDIMSYDIERKLENILHTAENAAELSDDAFSTSEEILGGIEGLEHKLIDLDDDILSIKGKIDSVITKFRIEPVYSTLIRKAKRDVMDSSILLSVYKGSRKINKNEIFEDLKSTYPWIPNNQLEEWFKEGIEELKKIGKKKR